MYKIFRKLTIITGDPELTIITGDPELTIITVDPKFIFLRIINPQDFFINKLNKLTILWSLAQTKVLRVPSPIGYTTLWIYFEGHYAITCTVRLISRILYPLVLFIPVSKFF